MEDLREKGLRFSSVSRNSNFLNWCDTREDLGMQKSKCRLLIKQCYLKCCISLHARCTRNDKDFFRFTPMRALIEQRRAHIS